MPLLEHGSYLMAKKATKRRAWTPEHLRTLKTMARKKTHAGRIAKMLNKAKRGCHAARNICRENARYFGGGFSEGTARFWQGPLTAEQCLRSADAKDSEVTVGLPGERTS